MTPFVERVSPWFVNRGDSRMLCCITSAEITLGLSMVVLSDSDGPVRVQAAWRRTGKTALRALSGPD